MSTDCDFDDLVRRAILGMNGRHGLFISFVTGGNYVGAASRRTHNGGFAASSHVYDPAENDNVPFEELPDDWHCPVCGAGKDQFEVR